MIEPAVIEPAVIAPAAADVAPPRSDLAQAARHGLVGLAGSMIAAIAGLLLNVVVGRGLGAAGSGAFFVVVAVVTVSATVAKVGADTGLVWSLARGRVLGRRREVSRTLVIALVPGVAVSTVFAVSLWIWAPELAALVADSDPEPTARALRFSAPFLVVAAPTLVLAAGLRGMGAMVPYAGVQNVLVPGTRPLLVGLTTVGGLGLSSAVLAWNIPWALGLAVAAWLVVRRARRVAVASALEPESRPWRQVGGEFWRFSVARSVAALLEVVIVWADVIIVAALASPREAGIYAAASRFITTGTLAEGAMRVALAPKVSQLLSVGDLGGAARLCGTATQWIVLLAWPLYLCLALYSPFALSLFGPEFTEGATSLTVLALAMTVVMAAGNSQTVLLMSGRSAWQMGNKGVALAVNLGANVLLVPSLGMLGAAMAWSLTVLLDAALVVLQVRHLVGVRIPMAAVVPVMGVIVGCLVPIGLVVRLTGAGVAASLAGVSGSLLLLAGALWLMRDRLETQALREAVSRRRG